jgi:hypothetical protein
MNKSSIEAIISALNDRQVKYLVVGGLAVVMHGHIRFTADLNLVLPADSANLSKTIDALKALDYRRRAPVPFDDLLDPEKRRRWVIEKQMTVFSLFSSKHPATEIDLFLEPPVDFHSAYGRAVRFSIAPGVDATFCSLDDLLAMKAAAGRPQDLEDIRNLQGKMP